MLFVFNFCLFFYSNYKTFAKTFLFAKNLLSISNSIPLFMLYPFIYPFIYSFIYPFIYPFIHLAMKLKRQLSLSYWSSEWNLNTLITIVIVTDNDNDSLLSVFYVLLSKVYVLLSLCSIESMFY